MLRPAAVETSCISSSTLDYGPLKLLAAAVLVSDASAIHLQTPVFYIVRAIKIFYPLYNAASSIVCLFYFGFDSLQRQWAFVRSVVTLLWICACIPEFMGWNSDPLSLPQLPGIEYERDSTIQPAASTDSKASERERKLELLDEQLRRAVLGESSFDEDDFSSGEESAL
jgi:hypothetical protein